jgi:hypothetical protein
LSGHAFTQRARGAAAADRRGEQCRCEVVTGYPGREQRENQAVGAGADAPEREDQDQRERQNDTGYVAQHADGEQLRMIRGLPRHDRQDDAEGDEQHAEPALRPAHPPVEADEQ